MNHILPHETPYGTRQIELLGNVVTISCYLINRFTKKKKEIAWYTDQAAHIIHLKCRLQRCRRSCTVRTRMHGK